MTDSESKPSFLWNKLVSEGIERGYVTYKEINDALPYEEIDPEIIEGILVTLDNSGIEIIEEAKVAVREAAKSGVKRILVTHPLASFCNYSAKDMKEMLDLGATYLEHTYNDVTRQVSHPIKLEDLYNGIRAIGPKHCIMSTDSGQWLNPLPAQQMGIYIKDMLNFGLDERDVRTMVSDNPAHMLGM